MATVKLFVIEEKSAGVSKYSLKFCKPTYLPSMSSRLLKAGIKRKTIDCKQCNKAKESYSKYYIILLSLTLTGTVFAGKDTVPLMKFQEKSETICW